MTSIEDVYKYLNSAGVELTQAQQVMVNKAIDRGTFLGVGSAIGRTALMPLVSLNGRTLDVIDNAGHYQQASALRCWSYPALPRTRVPEA